MMSQEFDHAEDSWALKKRKPPSGKSGGGCKRRKYGWNHQLPRISVGRGGG